MCLEQDPQFWTKVYGGAVKLRAAKKLQEEEEMLARGRVRKQTDRYTTVVMHTSSHPLLDVVVSQTLFIH